MEFLAWLEQTELSLWLRESDWGHPIVLCFHAVGMGLISVTPIHLDLTNYKSFDALRALNFPWP